MCVSGPKRSLQTNAARSGAKPARRLQYDVVNIQKHPDLAIPKEFRTFERKTPMQVRTIAFYNQQYPYGGGEAVTLNLAQEFRRLGLRVLLYTGRVLPEKLTPEDEQTLEFRELPHPGNFRDPQNAEFLCTSLRNEAVDCIIVQGITNFPFAQVHETTPSKVVFCLHNKPFWEIEFMRKQCAADISNPTLGRKLEFLLLRKPVYLFTSKLRRRTLDLYRRILQSVDKCVLLCEEYRRDFEAAISDRYGPECVRDKTAAILNPLRPVADGPMPEKERCILYVGRLVRAHKRVDRLLTIWKKIEPRHPDWQLLIIGEGEEREKLEQKAQRLGLRRLRFLGYRSDVASFYAKARFVCLTSNFEGLPMCLMEGQQYGAIPVSFGSYAGIREITGNGAYGIVVPPFDLREYADQLGHALEDSAWQETMSRENRAAARRYDPRAIGAEWLRLFDELQ